MGSRGQPHPRQGGEMTASLALPVQRCGGGGLASGKGAHRRHKTTLIGGTTGACRLCGSARDSDLRYPQRQQCPQAPPSALYLSLAPPSPTLSRTAPVGGWLDRVTTCPHT